MHIKALAFTHRNISFHSTAHSNPVSFYLAFILPLFHSVPFPLSLLFYLLLYLIFILSPFHSISLSFWPIFILFLFYCICFLLALFHSFSTSFFHSLSHSTFFHSFSLYTSFILYLFHSIPLLLHLFHSISRSLYLFILYLSLYLVQSLSITIDSTCFTWASHLTILFHLIHSDWTELDHMYLIRI